MQSDNSNKFIATRLSLLSRLENWGDQESWKDFFETYWKLIYSAATKAGLTDAEAQDVVQETVISVLKSLPQFRRDGERGSFKTWLMRLTSWRIVDQFRKRQREVNLQPAATSTGTGTGTAPIERVPDPAGLGLEVGWDEEWERNLMEAAVERVKRQVDPKHYQIFDLYVFKQWPVTTVARTMKVSPGRVYLVKHRIGGLIKKELARLQARPV